MREEDKKRARWDLFLILGLLLLGALLLLCLRLFRGEGTRAVVLADNEIIAQYPLAVDGEFALLGGKNILVIEDGAAYIRESQCPDHLCQRQGRIDSEGERIVCLPHHLTVRID